MSENLMFLSWLVSVLVVYFESLFLNVEVILVRTFPSKELITLDKTIGTFKPYNRITENVVSLMKIFLLLLLCYIYIHIYISHILYTEPLLEWFL